MEAGTVGRDAEAAVAPEPTERLWVEENVYELPEAAAATPRNQEVAARVPEGGVDEALISAAIIAQPEPNLVEHDTEGPPVPLGKYVASIRCKSRFRCLHRVGACHLVPGRDYQQYQDLGDELPAPSAYDAFCKKCFGKEGIVQAGYTESSSTSSGTSSSDD